MPWNSAASAAPANNVPLPFASKPADASGLSPAIRRQAAQWLVELQSDTASDTTRQDWQQWRDAHPDHERAWQRIEAFTRQLQSFPGPLAHQALAAPRRTRRRQIVKAAAVVFFAAGTTWTLRDTALDRSLKADRQTGAGEQASMALPDGSRVELNSGTAIAIRFGDRERALHLLKGEILVTTAHDPQSRPFMVRTAQGSLRALGTRFSVRELGAAADAQTRLAVFEGAVEIRPADADAAPQIAAANEQTRFTRDAIAPISAADEASIAWTQGLIVAQDMPLAEFLGELARHRPGHLGCSDAAANLQVTGVYPLADTDRVLAVLESTLPIRIRRFSRYWVNVQAKDW